MINFDAVDFSESRSEEARPSINFSDGGGGGGSKSKKNFKFFEVAE